MPAQSILGGINQETSQRELIDTLLLLISQIANNQPRLDTADRVLVSLAEAQPTVASVTSVTSVTTIAASGTAARTLDMLPLHMSNIGALHLYNNIIVS